MEVLNELPLVDAHCHRVLGGSVTATEFELCCTEADQTAPGISYLDTPLGAALRRWCPPVLGLAAGASVDEYLARRTDLGATATRLLLTAAGLSDLLVDTGIGGDELLTPAEVGAAAAAQVGEVVRLETVAERLAGDGVSAADFAEAYPAALAAATVGAVAVKSIVAYRHGLDIDPGRPAVAEVTAAARTWLPTARETAPDRLIDPVLLRFLLWCGLDTGLPIQIHTGFGDRDLRLTRTNPALLQPFLAAAEPSGNPIILLHCYPYQREAGWLAAVFPHVYADVGLTLSHVGARAGAVLAEFCELAPFGKLLFSTDAYRLPELYLVGAAQFRHALGALLTSWHAEGAMTVDTAERCATMIGADNARRIYRLS
ncbi:MAG TPA: amidohydrolase family protein [Pseudonocardiaceae bacterium]|jgi:hypothetical protein|nr:amidohydrolase family protein [Pseudonocardiaceae bacterium]